MHDLFTYDTQSAKLQGKRKIKGIILNYLVCLPCTLRPKLFTPWVKKFEKKSYGVFRLTELTPRRVNTSPVFTRTEGKTDE